MSEVEKSIRESTSDPRRVFVACLLSFAILITPIAAIAAPRSISARVNSPIVTEGATSSAAKATESSLTAAPAPVPEAAPAPPFAALTQTDCSSTITVTSNTDSGTGTLRQAIADVCDGGAIDFDIPGSGPDIITLATGQLVIEKNLTINGPTAKSLTISGDSMSRIFQVNAGVSLTFSNLTISGGQAASGGGVSNLGNLTILNSTLTGNTTTGNGGAIFTEGGVVRIINSTISGNNAGNGVGGGLYNGGSSQTTITNSTIAANNEGIRHLSSNPLLLNNTIVARNPDCGACDEVDIFVDNIEVPTATIDPASSNNLVGVDGGVVGISNGVNGNQIGSGEAPVNPLLGPLANNGGPTFTHALNNLSPAIDSGNNSLAVDQNNAALTTDQRGAGFPRIDHSVVDIGAYETTFVPPPPSANVGVSKLADGEEALADRDIIYTITVTNAGPDAAANVTLNDALPGDLTFVSMPTPAGWVCTTPAVGANGTVNCTNPSLAVGGNFVFTLTVHIPPSTPGGTEYHNVATVSSDTSDPESLNNQSAANTTVVSCLTNPVVGSNADSGAGSLRQAIAEACDGSVITFNMATVVSSITLTSGELLINKNLTITGPDANLLTISGNNASRVFNIEVSKTVGISGLTIANGRVASNGTNKGGGILNAGNLTIDSCTISNNTSTGGSSSINFAGGISNGTGTLNITNSTVSGNSAIGGCSTEGGGIANSGTLTITTSTISNNSVKDAGGCGGVNSGAGIFNEGTLTLTSSTLSGNAVSSSSSFNEAGGIFNSGNATVTNSTLSGNSVSGSTGSFNGGGGIYSIFNQLVIINSTISGNFVNGGNNQGGAVLSGGNGTLAIVSSTFSGNSATNGDTNTGGGIIVVNGTSNLRNTIVAGNSATVGADVSGAFTSQGNNLIGKGNDSTGFTNGVNNDKVGTNPSPINALLAALGDYGGPTQTHALLPGSPAIDAANNCVTDAAHCGDANIPQLTNDQRGFERQVNGMVDIGAFESRGFTIAATSGTPQSTAFNTAFANPLVATVSSAFGEPVAGGQLTFAAPGAGASATFTGGVTTINLPINASGQASASATANAILGGPYNVTATGIGVTGSALFSLTNVKANQTINFEAITNKTFGDADFIVSPTATSGLPVSLAASGQCTVTSPSPGTVHITGPGACTITASQAGNANFNAAPDVQQTFNMAKAASSTAVSSSVNPSDFGQSVAFTATVTGPAGTGTPTGTVQFKDSGVNLGAFALNASGVAQVTISSLTAGTHTITAEYSGDANYLASTGTLSGGQVVKPQPSLSVDDVSVVEGSVGTRTLTFTVTLSAASNLTVTVDYATANGAATSPSDYLTADGTLTFNPGQTSKTIQVTINGDITFEPDEMFTVNLSNPVNATISKAVGNGTIQNDDALGGFISFSQSNYSVNESAGIVTVTVTRSVISFSQAKNTANELEAARVDYTTDDTGVSNNCAAINTGLASQRCDYTSVFGTLEFGPNETQKTIDIPITLDAYNEGPEVFTVRLSNPTGGAVALPSTTTVTINDSASPTPNAIDDTTNFVRQQYRDFLNRDADAAGLAFWKDNIDKCNDPARRPANQTVAQCIEVQRIVTSAAFFLSIEFKQTGGTVREFYVAALDRPATNNMPNYIEFMRDTQAIQRGVIVGQGNWQQVLDANRTAFMNEFVLRAEFVGLYPTTDTPTQYVDKLYLHANVVPGNAQERLDAIAEFGGAPTATNAGARGRALLRITQNAAFQTREANRTFVQIEYFGYLRRNPNDLPDGNFNGYNFWVNKLNQFNGDFLQAEMVKAFLSSLEYRRRFGP